VTKFLHLGMSLDDALAKVTQVPAEVIGMAGRIGTLAPGAWADAVIASLEEGAFDLADCHRQVRHAHRKLTPRAVIRDGQVYTGCEAPTLPVHRHAH